MYRLSAFYFARTASDLPMDCTIPTVFIIIIYFMSGLKCAALPLKTSEAHEQNFAMHV